ncbi:MAG: hypothetical protein ACXW3S_07045, partial [Rhodoplanes sp.]
MTNFLVGAEQIVGAAITFTTSTNGETRGHDRRLTMSVLTLGEHPVQRKALWTVVVLVGTISLGVIALNRGETVNAAWLIVA